MSRKIFAVVLAAVLLMALGGAALADDDYSREIAAKVRKFLVDDDWHFSFDDTKGRFTFSVKMRGELQSLEYVIRIHDDGYTVYATSPVNADSDNSTIMNRVAEFISRANYGLRNGNFEFDFRDGEIRYMVFVSCEDALPSIETVKRSILIPGAMFKRYSPGMFDVMFRSSDAKTAVEKCESDDD